MTQRLVEDWLRGRVSLGAATGWTPEEMRIVADLGFALAEQGRDEEAMTIFEGLAAVAPATGYFQSALGALRLRNGDLSRALDHLNAALAADPRDIAALTNRGETHMRMGNLLAAVEDLRAAVRAAETRRDAALESSLVRARALLTRLEEKTSPTTNWR